MLWRDGSAGDALRHPLVLAMAALWLLNDHFLKGAYGNAWTGKLSDVASLAVFPLLPLCVYQIGCAWAGLRPARSAAILAISLFATGAVMLTINVYEPAAEAYRVGLGIAQWPFRGAWSLWLEGALPPLRPVVLTMDPSDLWTLPALLIPWWIGDDRGRRRASR